MAGISAKFEADFTQFKAAVESADNSLKGLEGSAKTVGLAILASLASTQVRQFAVDVKNVANQFIGAFAEEEAAVNRLGVALQAQGTSAFTAQYAELAAEFQRTTVFSDDLILSMQALLVQVGGVMPAQMQAALTASTNLAAGLGIDLRAATLLVGKAFAGETGSLTRYGIVIDQAKLKTEGASAVLAAINDKFGGQATAQLDTYTGKTAALTNQMGDFKEKIGQLLVDGLTPLLSLFASLPSGLQTTTLGLVAIGTAVTPLALSAAALVPVITGLATALGVTMAGALATLGTLLLPAGLVIAGLVAVYYAFKNWDKITDFVKQVYEGVKLYLVDKFQAIVAAIGAKVDMITGFFSNMWSKVVGHSIVPDMIVGIEAEFAKLGDVMVVPAQAATAAATEAFQGMAVAATAAAAIATGVGSGVSHGGGSVDTSGIAFGGSGGMQAAFAQYANLFSKSSVGSVGGGPAKDFLSWALSKGLASQGGGGATVHAQINVVDTEANLARRVAEEIAKQVRSGTLLPA